MKDQKKDFDINAVSLSDEILENVSGGNESWKYIWIDEGELYYQCEGCDAIYFTDELCPRCGSDIYSRLFASFGRYTWAWKT